jgi:regulatory protein
MEREKALSKCMHICSLREYCVDDIEKKMEKWKVGSNDVKYIIDKLLQDNFINHDRYVVAFINDKFLFNHWGKIKIRYHLKHKYVESNIIERHLEDIDIVKYEEVIDLEIKKKRRTVKGNSEFEINQKIARFLISKGFEQDKVFSRLRI